MLRHLFQLLSLLLSFCIPRNRKIWLFGSNMGYAGNTKYLYIHLAEREINNITPIWIGNESDVKKLISLGFKAYEKGTLKAYYYSMIAGVYIYNSYVSDINAYTFGWAKRINLWHGVGIKNIERKITVGRIYEIFHGKNLILKFKNFTLFIKPHIFLSTSSMMTKHFSDCFGIEENNCIESIYPRCNILLQDKESRLEFINKYEPIETKHLIKIINSYKKIYLYMPTMRDSGKDFLQDLGFDFNKLNNILIEHNIIFLLKLHPASKYDRAQNFSNIILLDNHMDIYPVMGFTDGLITDYSSVYYDYLLMENKEILLFIPDYEEYIKKERDLAFSYFDNTIGKRIYSFESLLTTITQKTDIDKNISYIRKKFWGEHSDTMDIFINKLQDKLAQ